MNKLKLAAKKKRLLIIVLVIAVLLAVGAYFLFSKKDSQPQSEPTITYSTDSPDESKANAENYNWKGAPDEPKKIFISSLGVDAYVQKAGVDQKNQVAVPNNVHLAGWFADSQKPGQNGLSIISGHVSGKTTDGVFKNLKNLQQGDNFEIELGNGEVKRYKVIENHQVKEAESANYPFSQNPKVKKSG